MNILHKQFTPLTATPFYKKGSYMEYRPGKVLQPFIPCYWSQNARASGSAKETGRTMVTPDGCMDIIFHIDTKSDQVECLFAGINDKVFMTEGQAAECEVFAIRFYFWAVHLFISDTLKDSCNIIAETDQFFSQWCSYFQAELHGNQPIEQQIRIVEQFLLKKLDQAEANHNLLNAVDAILNKKGNITVEEVCNYANVSQRQMERIFRENIGITMKKTASLMRYQNIWKDRLMEVDFNIQDCVVKYGYTDQSHLLKEFKRFHGMRLSQAQEYAVRYS